MICSTEEFKLSCSVILQAVSSSLSSSQNDLLEMFVESKYLYLAVTNKESYVKVKVCSCEDNDFHATVNATVFLQLMSKISSASVEFAFNDQSLLVNANGHYKIPLIYVDGEIATLETINLSNIIENFDVKNSILDSLSKYNSKQLSVGILNNAV